MEPLQNENGTSSPLQRLLIGLGAFIVIALTVIAAIFLAMQDLPDDGQSTPVVQVSPTRTASGVTPGLTPPTFTPIPPSSTPTNTPTDTPTPSVTPEPPPIETTPAPETAEPPPTDTPVPPPPTFTPVPPSPTATPTPAAFTDCGVPPPEGWVAYTVQQNETLKSLTDRSETSVLEVQRANCLPGINIQSGQVIYLPSTPATVTPSLTPTTAPTRGPTPTRTGTPIAPRITNAIARQTDSQIVIIVEGENFRPREAGFRAELVGPTIISLDLGDARTNTGFEASAPIPADLPGTLPRGAYDLIVTNPSGRLATRTGVFPPGNATPTVTPAPPEITRVSPSSGRISEDVLLTIQGRNFRPLESGFKVEIRSADGNLSVELPVDETVRPATATSFDVTIGAGSLTVGSYDLLVTNPNGQTDIERDAYDAIE